MSLSNQITFGIRELLIECWCSHVTILLWWLPRTHMGHKNMHTATYWLQWGLITSTKSASAGKKSTEKIVIDKMNQVCVHYPTWAFHIIINPTSFPVHKITLAVCVRCWCSHCPFHIPYNYNIIIFQRQQFKIVVFVPMNWHSLWSALMLCIVRSGRDRTHHLPIGIWILSGKPFHIVWVDGDGGLFGTNRKPLPCQSGRSVSDVRLCTAYRMSNGWLLWCSSRGKSGFYFGFQFWRAQPHRHTAIGRPNGAKQPHACWLRLSCLHALNPNLA